MTDEDLKVYIEDVISDMVNSGELEAGENFEAEEEVDIDVVLIQPVIVPHEFGRGAQIHLE